MTDMKHVAILRSGGQVEITLPLKPTSGMAGLAEHHRADPAAWPWREDQNGVLINLDHVAAIVGAPVEPEPSNLFGLDAGPEHQHYRCDWPQVTCRGHAPTGSAPNRGDAR